MPARISRDPFGNVPPGGNRDRSTKLLTPEFRVLDLLKPADPTDHPVDWPVYSRAIIGYHLGLSAISGTVTRAVNGTRPGGVNKPHPGLLAQGLVEEVVMDLSGVSEVCYRITAAGIRALEAHRRIYGEPGRTRDKESSTNDRYRRKEDL